MEVHHTPDGPPDHLADYLSSVHRMSQSFHRVGHEQRLLAEQWMRVLASLRALEEQAGAR